MREPAPDKRPVVLTVAGSDSGGGAGIQADLKTIEAGGGFGTSAVTAVTAQHTRGVESTHVVPLEEIEAQLEAVYQDFDVAVLKTGMLATEPIIDLVTDYAGKLDGGVVVDPVMVAASGDRLLDAGAEAAYENLLGEAMLATPNADEATALTGIDVTDSEGAVEAGRELLDTGVNAVLVKGGHLPGEAIQDVLVTPDGTETFTHPRVETDATHGSGCMLASAVATRLAHGDTIEDAVEAGTNLLERAVRYHHDVGKGPGTVHHLVSIREAAARNPTREAVEDVVDELVSGGVETVVPEVGMNVVGATPYAEAVGETAAVEGRIVRTLSGAEPHHGVRFGASSHVARFLLTAREHDPSLRFAVNCRFDGDVEAALPELDGPAVEVDRGEEPDPDEEGATMGWVARQAFDRVKTTPAAVYDRGDVGKEAITRVLAPDAETAVSRVETLTERGE